MGEAGLALPYRQCSKRTWTETSPAIVPWASLTEGARAEVYQRIGKHGASVAAVAREFGIGWIVHCADADIPS